MSERASRRAGGRATPRGLEALAPGAAIYNRLFVRGGGERGAGGAERNGAERRGREGATAPGEQPPPVPFPRARRRARGAGTRRRGTPAARHARGRPVTAGGERHGV